MSKSIDAGKATVTLGIKNNIDKGLKRAQSSLNSFGNKSKAIGTKMMGVGTALAAPFGYAALKFMQFDDAIRMTGAVAQASDADFEMMKQKALELGRTTSFTAGEVAGLMTELARAGFKPDEINNMTGAVLNLAKATGTDATLASGIMAATMRQFGLDASQAARAADALTAGANMSFNSVESLGDALQYAGPVAADMGMSVEETVAILGTLGNVGIQGSSAGNALKRLTTLTAAESKKMKQIFGVDMLDTAGNARPLVDALGDIAEATNGLPTGERAEKFNKAFGLLGITGASAISKNAANTRELLDNIKAAGGIAERTAEKMEDGLGGSFRKLLSAAEGLVLAVGESLAPALKVFADLIVRVTGPITEWIAENQWLVQTIFAVAAGLFAGGAALVSFGLLFNVAAAGIGGVVAVIGILGTTLGWLLSPIALAMAGFAGLAFAFWKYSDSARTAINWLKDTFKPLVDTVGEAVRAIGALLDEGKMTEAWDLAVDAMMFTWLWLTNGIRDVWTETVTWVLNMGSALAMGIGSVFEALGGAIKEMLDGYASYYDTVYNAVAEQLGELTGVRTIGGYSNQSAFDDTFGEMRSTIESAAEKIAEFGAGMGAAAEADIAARNADADARKKARAEELARRQAELMERSTQINDLAAAADAEIEKKQESAEILDQEQKQREAQLDEAQAVAGPNATFDAFAASIIGMGPRFENESLKAQKETAKNTADIAKNVTLPTFAEFTV